MTSFEEIIKKLPENERCFQGNSGKHVNWQLGECFFGIPPYELYGREPLNSIPKSAVGFHFYLGADSAKILSAFCSSVYSNNVECLAVGDSSYASQNGRNYYQRDYEQVIKVLEDKYFPKLRFLSLGIWQLFSNSHSLYGVLGDITQLLKNNSHIEELTLGGNFTLAERVEFTNLKELTINLDDPITGINGGYISQDTLENLLSSNFPNLEVAWIDLDCEDNEYEYVIPDIFLSAKNVPKLKQCEFNGGFKAGSQRKIIMSNLASQTSIDGLVDII